MIRPRRPTRSVRRPTFAVHSHRAPTSIGIPSRGRPVGCDAEARRPAVGQSDHPHFQPGRPLIASNASGEGLHATLPATGTYKVLARRRELGGHDHRPVRGRLRCRLRRRPGDRTGRRLHRCRAVEPLHQHVAQMAPFPARVMSTCSPSISRRGPFMTSRLTLPATSPGKTASSPSIMSMASSSSTRRRGDSTKPATGFGFRTERTGRHFITIQATQETGLGGYSVSGRQTSSFPPARRTALFPRLHRPGHAPGLRPRGAPGPAGDRPPVGRHVRGPLRRL